LDELVFDYLWTVREPGQRVSGEFICGKPISYVTNLIEVPTSVFIIYVLWVLPKAVN